MLVWISDKPFLWKAGAVIVTVLFIAMAAFMAPFMWTEIGGADPSLGIRLSVVGFIVLMAALMVGLMVLLAKASPVVLRLSCAFAIISWSMNAAVIFLFSAPGEFVGLRPFGVVGGTCAAALAICLVIDLFRTPSAR